MAQQVLRDELMTSTDHAASVLVGHPVVARLLLAGRRLREWDVRHPWGLDITVVLVVVVLFCAPDLVDDHGRMDAPVTFAARPLQQIILSQGALLLPLWWRRRAPLTTLYAVLAVFVVEWSLGVFLRADVAVLVAVYSLVLHGRLSRLPWAAPGLVAAAAMVVLRLSSELSVWDVSVFVVIVGTSAVALGFAIRLRRAQLAALRERAAQLEIERDQRSQLATAAERTRMAREMHDIIGHSLSVIITLADGGSHAADTAPERGKQALQLIGDTGRSSLGELRRMLGILREQTDQPSLSPQPGFADLHELCRQIKAAGPQVKYESSGSLDSLPVGVQLTAYRIVQEALTNALRHAGPDTRIQLTLRFDGRRLQILVSDTGPADRPRDNVLLDSFPSRPRSPGLPDTSPSAGAHPEMTGLHETGTRLQAAIGAGHGLVGMRERASLYGGTVTAGPVAGGGWTVHAELDLDGASA